MPFFLRRVSIAHWQGRLPVTDENLAAGRRDFVLGDADTDGLSLFEAEAEEDRRLVVAAIACNRMNLGAVDLLEIEDSEVRAFGQVATTPGGYPIDVANRLHRSLPWQQPALNALADHLTEHGRRATRHKKADVKAALASVALEGVDAGPHREWVASLRGTL